MRSECLHADQVPRPSGTTPASKYFGAVERTAEPSSGACAIIDTTGVNAIVTAREAASGCSRPWGDQCESRRRDRKNGS
jgi:hypothetical protein